MSPQTAWLRASLLSFSLLGAACSATTGSTDEDEGAAEAVPGTSLVFDTKGARATGELKAGDTVAISYDANRLPSCRGDKNGKPGWSIAANYRIAGGETKTVWVAGYSADGKTSTPTIALSDPGDLEIWFEVTSVFGCHAYDSDYGKNFHFNVSGTKTASSIRFGKSGTPTTSGALVSPGAVTIEYDAARLPTCRGTQAGIDQWTITGNASLNGKKPVTFTVAGNGAKSTTSIDLTESGKLEIWFENTNRYGCHEYDSNSGANYAFTVGR